MNNRVSIVPIFMKVPHCGRRDTCSRQYWDVMQNLSISYDTPDLIRRSLAQAVCGLLHIANNSNHLEGKNLLPLLLRRHALTGSRIIEEDLAPTNIEFDARPWRFVMLSKPLTHMTKSPRGNVVLVNKKGDRPQPNNVAEIVDATEWESPVFIRVSRRKQARAIPITELTLCQSSQLTNVIGGKCDDCRH